MISNTIRFIVYSCSPAMQEAGQAPPLLLRAILEDRAAVRIGA